MDRIRYCAQIATIYKTEYLLRPYSALTLLLEIKSAGTRPICNLVCLLFANYKELSFSWSRALIFVLNCQLHCLEENLLVVAILVHF